MTCQIINSQFKKLSDRSTACLIETDTGLEVVGVYTMGKKMVDKIPDNEREAHAFQSAEYLLMKLLMKLENKINNPKK